MSRRIRAAFVTVIVCSVVAQAFGHDPVTMVGPAGGGVFNESLAPGQPGADPLTGGLRYEHVFQLPPARGDVQPSLSLKYSSAALREGDAGFGWSLGMPSIAREPLSGWPAFDDATDRFSAGGEPLVFVCIVGGPGCPRNETFPDPLNGTRYYRAQVERRFARYFLTHDGQTWVVQEKGGGVRHFGRVDLEKESLATGVIVDATDRDSNGAVFRWHLALDQDAHRNPVVYVWRPLGARGLKYLTDIFDTPPSDRGAALTLYANHTQLDWESNGIAFSNYAHIDRALPDRRLQRIASASMGTGGVRSVVRAYWIGYLAARAAPPLYDERNDAPLWGHSFVKNIQNEGRCGVKETSGRIPLVVRCPMLPPVSFEYSPAKPGPFVVGMSSARGVDPTADADFMILPGPETSAIIDVNHDGLPDVVQSWWPIDGLVDPKLAPAVRFQWAYLNRGGGGFGESLKLFLQKIDAGGVQGGILAPNGNKESFFLSPRRGASVLGAWGDAALLWSKVDYAPVTFRCALQDASRCATAVAAPPDPQTVAWKWSPDPGGRGWLREASISGQNQPERTWFTDVDSDGYPDALGGASSTLPPPSFSDLQRANVQFSRRFVDTDPRHPRRLVPFAFDAKAISGTSVTPVEKPRRETRFFFVDVTGDGLTDLVSYNPHDNGGVPGVRPGDGRGRFQCDSSKEPGPCSTGTPVDPDSRLIGVPGAVKPWPFNDTTYFHDVTGDGLADIVRLEPQDGSVKLWINHDGHTFFCANPASQCLVGKVFDDLHGTFNIADKTVVRVAFAGMDASGVDDLVVMNGAGVWSFSPFFTPPASSASQRAPRPGLLIRIHNGYGATQEITYHTIQELDLRASTPWQHHSPQVMPVVTKIATVTPNLPAPYELNRETTFEYRDPAYDFWERRFLGFRKVRESHGGEQAVTETTYWFGACQRSLEACLESSDDHPSKAWTGRPIQIARRFFVDITSGIGWLSITDFKYTAPLPLFDTSEPRHVWFSSLERVRTYLYDPSLSSDDGDLVSRLNEDPFPEPRRQASRVEMVREYAVDTQGHLAQSLDLGRPRIDEPIETTYTYAPCDAEWRCPLQTSTTRKSRGPDTFDRRERYTYTSAGDLSDVERFLEGSEPLQRFHENPAAPPAPPPPDASTSGWKNVLHLEYDAQGLGNVVMTRGPNGRCATFDYDSAYRQFRAVIRNHVAGCGSSALVSLIDMDRGLGAPLSTTDPRGAVSDLTYDEFGRLQSMDVPRPDATPASRSLGVRFIYRDGNPLSDVTTQWFTGGFTPVESVQVMNALGETVLAFQKADAKDPAPWIVTDFVERDRAGRVKRAFRPFFFTGNPSLAAAAATAISPTPGTGQLEVTYDWFGRLEATRENGEVTGLYRYSPLVVAAQDMEQLKRGGPHAGLSSQIEIDGHGRTIRSSRQIQGDTVTTEASYLVTGELREIIQRHAAGTDHVVRRFQYDSFGRLVKNMEPNTSTRGRSWMYAWDDGGRLVGTSDARGCGKNLFYDGVDRLVAEDYIPCRNSHAAYSPPNLATGDGTESFLRYDVYLPGQVAPEPDFGDLAVYASGRLVSIQDRGAFSRFNYDVRGRVRRVSRQIVAPGPPANALATRYSAHSFVTRSNFDFGDRLIERTTGIDAPKLLNSAANQLSRVFFEYSDRALLKRIGSSHGELLSNAVFDAEGLPLELTYGDVAGTKAEMRYDARKRIQTYVLSRSPTPVWTTPTDTYRLPDRSTTQTELIKKTFAFDDIGNVTRIADSAQPGGWPLGSGPFSIAIDYDGMYRVAQILYGHSQSPAAVSPLAPETAASDPGPAPLRSATNRVLNQTFRFDWKGNLVAKIDDASLLYDRSLGLVTNGELLGKPNQIVSAGGNAVRAQYDEAGHLVDVTVQRQGSCPSGGASSCAQRYVFDWDEVGQLARARRWDFAGNAIPPSEPRFPALPTTQPVRDLAFAYSQGQRMLKSVRGANLGSFHTLEVFDTLRISRAKYDPTTREYERSERHETAYLGGIGRVALMPGAPSPNNDPVHLLLEVGDHTGSTSVVLDAATSEVIERTQYEAGGAVESDYRPERWRAFREDYKFSGKEEDLETGLVYFGARYYHPRLGTWISPDPLTVHSAAGNLNPYSFVSGALLNRVDAQGLDDCPIERTCVRVIERPDPPAERSNSRERDTDDRIRSTPSGDGPTSRPPPLFSSARTPAPPTPFQLSIDKMPGYTVEGDWQSKFYAHIYPDPKGIPKAMAALALPVLVPRLAWLALAAVSTTQIQSSDDAAGHVQLAGYLLNAATAPVPQKYPEGSFSITSEEVTQASGRVLRYPTGVTLTYGQTVTSPVGQVVFVRSGPAYSQTRAAANAENDWIRRQFSALRGGDAQIHETVPVQFGGSPTGHANKLLVTGSEHQVFSDWWAALYRNIHGR